jgi:hypothetical protein
MPDNDTLTQLAAEIRSELAQIDGRSTLQHAIAAGERLNQAKALAPRGTWLGWLEANCPVGQPMANRYMRLASNYARVHNLDSIRDALDELKPKRPPAPKTERPTKPRSKEGAQRKRMSAEQRRRAQRDRDVALVDLLKQQERLGEIVRILETTDFVAEFDLEDIAVDALVRFADDLVTTIEWCDRAIAPVRARLGVARIAELIRKLENTDGRAPAEAEIFHRRAAILRRKHGLELVA